MAEVAATAAIVGVIGVVIAFFIRWVESAPARARGVSLEQRINYLSSGLKDAAQIIDLIEAEIRARQELADMLKNDAETFNKMADMKKSEVEAVAQVLQGSLATHGRKTFWQGVVGNFVFFMLGAVVTAVISFLF